MVGRMGGGLHFLVEIELEMTKIPPFTNLNRLEEKHQILMNVFHVILLI